MAFKGAATNRCFGLENSGKLYDVMHAFLGKLWQVATFALICCNFALLLSLTIPTVNLSFGSKESSFTLRLLAALLMTDVSQNTK